MEFFAILLILIKSNMPKRTRSMFEAITFIADGREYNVHNLLNWDISEIPSVCNPEEVEYGISLKCLDFEMWVRCKNQIEQLTIADIISSTF
jgi:hypothetical protein